MREAHPPPFRNTRRYARYGTGLALGISVLAMVSLHVAQPALSPTQAPISFYVHGAHGWLLSLALGSFGAAAIELSVASRTGDGARRAFWALAWFGAGMLITAFVPSDHWFPWQGSASLHGLVHATAAVIGPAVLLGAMLPNRHNSQPADRLLRAFAYAYVIGLASSGASLLAGFAADDSPPYIGLAERWLALSAVAWMGRRASIQP